MTAWGGWAGAGVTIALAIKTRRILAAFEDKQAFGARSAQTLPDLGLRPSRLLERLKRKGVLVAIDGHRYYLDGAQMQRLRRNRLRRALLLLLVLIAAVVVVLWWKV